ncbi:MAG: lipopolysaccharide heptosyltransferase II [Candidatus Eisenbacteria bacterium]|nr:lipopolysaccharide heptosyltransferase II [Candidatus Eisenbacteria bacterium]
MRILVVQTAFAGDVLLTVPLLRALRSLPGTDRLAALVTPAGAAVLETQTLVDEFIIYDKRGGDRGSRGLVRVARALRSFGPDAAVVPHRSFRSALLSFLSGAGRRIGFRTSGGRVLLTDVLPYDAGRHEVERVASLAGPLGSSGAVTPVPFSLEVPDAGRNEVADLLSSTGVAQGARVVSAAPGSRWATKRWPPERFAAALTELAARLDAAPVLIGSADDAAAASEVLGAAERDVVDLTGRLTVAGWLALVERSAVLLSNDSAAQHVAAGVGTPVVSVFGPTVPAQGFGPYGESGRVVEAELACRPCGRHGAERCPVGTQECMRNVPVEAVVDAALALAARRSSDRRRS